MIEFIIYLHWDLKVTNEKYKPSLSKSVLRPRTFANGLLRYYAISNNKSEKFPIPDMFVICLQLCTCDGKKTFITPNQFQLPNVSTLSTKIQCLWRCV